MIKPEVGQIWKHRYSKNRVFITQGLPIIITLEENGVFAPINAKYFFESFCYVGKSKINFKDLFKTVEEK